MPKSLLFDINEVLELFRNNKTIEMRGLSNRLIRESSMNNNKAKAELGVIAYALHKIETKEHFLHSSQWGKVKSNIIRNLNEGMDDLKRENLKGFIQNLKEVILEIEKIDSELGHFATSLYDKAKVKQASLAYSYGMSIAQAAELTGADKKELQSYVGFTTMPDEEQEDKNITKRVQELKEILKNRK